MGNAVTEYRIDADRLLQLNYRFVDRDYIQATFRRDESGGNTYTLPEYQRDFPSGCGIKLAIK